MGLSRRGWTLVGALLAVLLVRPGYGQVALTTVQDTVYSADGAPAQGTVLVSWSAFTTVAGNAVAAGSTSATIGAGGALSVALAPNAGAMPTGSYYTAVFHLNDGTTSRQYWVLPVSGSPVKLAAVENQVLPTSVAMQTVSKAYVDTAIAAAVTGTGSSATSPEAYVQKSGDTMTGPLALPGDPVSALQAADKHYVDANVAAISGGMAQKVGTLPSATQTVVQPAGTQLEVNALNGLLDATGFLSGGGNNGIGNALASSNCTSGCTVNVSPTYPGNDAVPFGGVPSGTHMADRRGGADVETFQNPLGETGSSNIAESLNQVTTRTAQQAYAARPSVGANSIVMSLTHTVPTGGSNQFPADTESVPYSKSNYGVLALVGNYHTQGQHVQLGNEINCYSVGDCLAGSQFITTSGGYRDEADEGTHPFDLQVNEDTRVFQGTCGNGCTTGSTTVAVNATANGGTQGDGRFLMDKNPAKVISTGSIVGLGGDVFEIVTFSGTNFPVSTFLETAAAATSQPGNLQPGTVTLPIATSGLPSAAYAASTAALPATSGVACVADGGTWPNFETANYTVVDATHIQLTLNKVHRSGAVIGVGGLCGYGLEQTVDTVGQVKQIFPVMGALSPTKLYYTGALTGVVAWSAPQSTSGYLNVSLPVASAVRNGNVVTLTTTGSFPYDLNGLSLTVSGVADASFNGTFQVSTTGANTLTYSNSGADGTSSGGTLGAVTGGFALYPMAEVLSVYNASTAAVDGTMTLAPNTVAWAAGDAVEEPHYYQQSIFADMEFVTQYVPRPVSYTQAGKVYQGQLGPGARGWMIQNAVPASNYLGAGGTHQPPDSAFMATGVWRNSIEAQAGQEAVVRVHCNLHACNRWNSWYALFSMDSHLGQDFLMYDPNADSATWNLAGTLYSFSPTAFTAPTINVGTLNATSIASGTAISSGSPAGTVLPIVNTSGGGSQYNIEVTGSGSSFPNNGLIYHDVTNGRYPFWYSAGGNAGIWAQSAGIYGWSSNGTDPRGDGVNGLDTGLYRMSAGYICASASPLTPSCNGTMGAGRFHETLTTPASSSAACSPGDFTDDANFHYVCVAANTWRRVALSSF